MPKKLIGVKMLQDGNVYQEYALRNGKVIVVSGSLPAEREYLSPGDVRGAAGLASKYGVAPVSVGIYGPDSGMSYLITLLATYQRGSRAWSEPVEAEVSVESVEKTLRSVATYKSQQDV